MSGHPRLAARLGDVIGGHVDGADGDVSADIAAGVAVGFAVFVVGALAIAAAPLTIAATIVAVTVAGGTALGAGGFMTALLADGQLTALEEGPANEEVHLGGAPCSNVVGICSSNVYIENKLVARARSDHGAHNVSPVLQGSATVHVNGSAAPKRARGVEPSRRSRISRAPRETCRWRASWPRSAHRSSPRE